MTRFDITKLFLRLDYVLYENDSLTWVWGTQATLDFQQLYDMRYYLIRKIQLTSLHIHEFLSTEFSS
jgi:hypothetical protein